jgi:hypothetical protein
LVDGGGGIVVLSYAAEQESRIVIVEAMLRSEEALLGAAHTVLGCAKLFEKVGPANG